VIAIPEKHVKVSMRSAYMIPRVSIIDPELMLSIPPAITASTGMDALTQVIEPYVSNSPNPMVDMFCQNGISLAAQSLLAAYIDGKNLKARENMAFASLLGGLSLANGKLGAVHGFAGPIGGMFNASHGVICAALLPAVMKVNAEIVAKSTESQTKLDRFRNVACWLTGDEKASIQDGVNWILDLASALHIPGLSSLGISEADFPAIIENAQASSSMKGNPVVLTPAQMEQILATSM
jgi:alcohol dehydrogenase class IV